MNLDELMTIPRDFQEIRIENTNRCGYSCVFCPREKMDRPQDVMPMDDFGLVMDRVREYNPDYQNWFHLHGFGEPLLDKYLPEKILIAKSLFPRSKILIITTLGVNVGEDYLRSLIECGLDSMTVSFYASTRESYKAVTNTNMFDTALKNLIAIGKIARSARYFEAVISKDLLGFAGGDAAGFHQGDWFTRLIKSFGFRIVQPPLHNYGDGREYNPADWQGACTVFTGYRRNVLQITWDMNVKPCTFDFNATMKLGNLRTQSIATILDGQPYRELALAQLTNDMSRYPVCANCDRHQ